MTKFDTETDYRFDLMRMLGKVDAVARQVAKSYNQSRDWEDISQDAKMHLFTKYEELEFATRIVNEKYENAVIRNAVIQECRKLANYYLHAYGHDYYNMDWLKLNIDDLVGGMDLPTIQFVESNELGVDVRMVISSRPADCEYSDFGVAFTRITEHEQDLFVVDRDTPGLRSQYSRAMKKLLRLMNNVAKERGVDFD